VFDKLVLIREHSFLRRGERGGPMESPWAYTVILLAHALYYGKKTCSTPHESFCRNKFCPLPPTKKIS